MHVLVVVYFIISQSDAFIHFYLLDASYSNYYGG